MDRGTTLFMLGFVAAGVLAVSPAEAKYQRYSGVFCTNVEFATQNINVDVTPSWYGMVDTGTSAADLSCPVDDDLRFPKSAVNTLNVYVRDENTADDVAAYACVTTYPSNGYACGTGDDTGVFSNTGDYTLHPDLSIWQSSSYSGAFPFVFVYLPSSTSNGSSNLRGFYTSS